MDQSTAEHYDKIRLELRRGAISLALLAALREPQYGYSLRKRLVEAGLDVDEGTLYPLLRRLEGQGLLHSQWREMQPRPRRYYHLNANGKKVLAELGRDWKALDMTLNTLLEIQS